MDVIFVYGLMICECWSSKPYQQKPQKTKITKAKFENKEKEEQLTIGTAAA